MGESRSGFEMSSSYWPIIWGILIDRNLNASWDLRNLVKIGPARSEYTPREMTTLDFWSFSKDPTSIDELGSERQACMRKIA